MKTDIQPKYYEKATITCSCGHVFTVGSTVEKMQVEVCSNCHPFYTGKKKLVDSAGQVDRFQKRMAMAEKLKKKQEKKKKAVQTTKKTKAKKEAKISQKNVKQDKENK